MNLVNRCLAILAAAFLWVGAVNAQSDEAAPDESPTPVIAVTADAPSDDQIRNRLEDIFGEIGQLSGIDVDVSNGVVSLSGNASNESQADRALNLARRVEGVVTVEDNIERVLDVQGNVAPLIDQFSADAERWLRATPLILLSLVIFLAIAFAGYGLSRWTTLWQRLTPNPFLTEIITQAVRIAAVVFGLVVALNLLGATTLMATIIGGAGVLGLAIGFAVRDTMENYISSIMLSLRQPFLANEHVKINEHEGRVVRLTSRATVLMTLDGNHLRIPNAMVFKAVILNYTRNPERRFSFELGIDANDDPLSAMKTGLDALRALNFVLSEPKPDAIIQAVGDSNIVICFLGWVDQNNSDFQKARSVAIRAAKNALESNGFTLPEPIYRLRFDGSSAPLPSELTTDRPAPKPAVAASALDTPDVRPDDHIEKIVEEERTASSEPDLLDQHRAVEY